MTELCGDVVSNFAHRCLVEMQLVSHLLHERVPGWISALLYRGQVLNRGDHFSRLNPLNAIFLLHLQSQHTRISGHAARLLQPQLLHMLTVLCAVLEAFVSAMTGLSASEGTTPVLHSAIDCVKLDAVYLRRNVISERRIRANVFLLLICSLCCHCQVGIAAISSDTAHSVKFFGRANLDCVTLPPLEGLGLFHMASIGAACH